jgi:tetratricopeptide (TPR) repeat protein
MNIRFILIFLSFFVLLSSLGQVKEEVKKINIDSLEQVLPDLVDIEKIDALNKISFAIARDQTNRSISIANNTEQLSEDLDHPKGIADAFLNKGIAYLYKDSLKPSVIYLLNALRIYEDLEPCVEMGTVLEQLQAVNFYTRNYEKSKIYGRQAAKIFDLVNKYRYKARVLTLLGLACTEISEFDSATYYFSKALDILDIYPAPYIRTSIYYDQGRVHAREFYASGDTNYLSKAIPWYLKAIELSEEIKDSVVLSFSLYDLGSTYINFGTEKSIKKGVAYLYRQKNIVINLRIRIHNVLTHYKGLARVEFNKGNYDKAAALITKGLSEIKFGKLRFNAKYYPDPLNMLLDKHYYLVEIQRAYRWLYEISLKKEDFRKAIEYYILYDETSDEILMKDNQSLISMLEADSENEKTQKQIDLLERDKEISELKVDQSRNINIGAGILLAILVFFGIVLFRQNKLRNEHKSTLLEQKLLRLQMNPHFIFNSLANIQEYIWNKDPMTANEYLSSFSKLVRLTLENSRYDFVPVEKEVSTIENYLNLQKLRHKDKFVYTIHVDPEIDQENMQIPPMLVQPFIENSIEHGIMAKETLGHIDVKFILKGDQINVEITDDGIGFKKSTTLKRDKKKEHQSLAMSITQERLMAHYRKYKRKIQIKVSDLRDANNNVMGARVFFGIPFAEAQ